MGTAQSISLERKEVDKIADLLTPYIEAEALNIDNSYTWKIPSNVPISDFDPSGLSLANANFKLKRALSEAWLLFEADRPILARWYVRSWGGIRRIREATLQTYVVLPEADLERASLTGVASWSKILTMRNPSVYAIFDARVSAALNAIQIKHTNEPILFPDLPSRNSKISDFQRWTRAKLGGVRRISKNTTYASYMTLLREVERRLGHDSPDQTEMVLFANAIILAGSAMKRPEYS